MSTPIYQCDYLWRGTIKCSHLSWRSWCQRHGKDTREVGRLSIQQASQGGGE